MDTESTKLPDFENYIGDVNLEYGGTFYNLENWRYGYVDALRIMDLDSGCGFAGAVIVERITVIVDSKKHVKAALQCCGLDIRTIDRKNRPIAIADCVMWYGRYDPDGEPLVIQTNPEFGPMEFDGWIADVALSVDDDLFAYLLREGYLADFS